MQEYRPSSFKILPDVVKHLLIVNVLVLLATYVAQSFGVNLIALGGLFYVGSDYFHPYQFVTHMFMHGGFFHLFVNMFALWMFGSQLENVWGPKRFLFFYLFTGLGAAVLHSLVTYLEVTHGNPGMANVPTVGASGAVFGILVAFAMLFPNTRLIFLFFPFPIKAKYFVAFYALFELFAGIRSTMGGVDNIAHFAHLGGALFGFILVKYWQRSRTNFF